MAKRLEGNGIRASGRLTVPRLDFAERQCVAELLGRPVITDRVSIDLEVLDRLLVERDGSSLVAALEEVRGAPLVARSTAQPVRTPGREEPFVAAGDWVTAHPGAVWPWAAGWVAGLRRDGTLLHDHHHDHDHDQGRDLDHDPTRLLQTALEVLWDRRDALAQSDASASDQRALPPVTLTGLAERTVRDPHGLDDDRLLAEVVLRALAARAGAEPPRGRSERRALWETAAVVTDLVASTCLTWGLLGPGMPDGLPGVRRPVHLTWWDLETGVEVGAPEVLVCESPRILEAIARAGIDIGVVCTDGRSDLLLTEVLARVRAGGARLRYHGDLDWPGVARANDARTRHGAAPWSMGAADYLTAPGSRPLSGPAVEPAWDPELASAMRRRGVAVHAEAVVEQLVGRLRDRLGDRHPDRPDARTAT